MSNLKLDLPDQYVSEWQEYHRIKLLGTQRSQTGTIAYTSPSSGVTYNSTSGQVGILQQLQLALNPYMISASDINEIEVLSNEVVSHLADIMPHGKFAHASDVIYTGDLITQVDDKIGGVLRRRSTLSYTGNNITGINIKLYANDGITLVQEFNDTINYSSGNITGITRVVV